MEKSDGNLRVEIYERAKFVFRGHREKLGGQVRDKEEFKEI